MVGLTVADGVHVGCGVSVDVGTGLNSRDGVEVERTNNVGVKIAVMVMVGMTDAVAEGVNVGVSVGVGVEVTDAVAVSVGSRVGVGVGERPIAWGTVTGATCRRDEGGGAAAWSQAGRAGVGTWSAITPPRVGVADGSPNISSLSDEPSTLLN